MADEDLIEIRVPMIVTADGKWAVSGSSAANGEPDWAWLDESCDYENQTINPTRYWITAYVRRPKVGEIRGAAIRDDVGTVGGSNG